MFVSVPREETNIFFEWFYCQWFMEIGDNWSYWHDRQKRIESVLLDCNYNSSSFFQMLVRAHDIIYDR